MIVQLLLNKESLQNEKIEKLSNDTKLEINDIKACIALVEFILTSAAKYNVNSETLSFELQQLGLPKGLNIYFNHLTIKKAFKFFLFCN